MPPLSSLSLLLQPDLQPEQEPYKRRDQDYEYLTLGTDALDVVCISQQVDKG